MGQEIICGSSQQLGLNPREVAKQMALNSKNKVNALQSSYGLCESMEGQLYA